MKNKKINLDYEKGSENVFADIGLSNAEELKTKTLFVIEIKRIVKKRKLKQAKIAEILGISQPKVSNLLKGKSSGFSTERLMRFLNALDQDININIKPKPKNRDAHISVSSQHTSNPISIAAKGK
jgi:predicted XRE-type DNA-binding protein